MFHISVCWRAHTIDCTPDFWSPFHLASCRSAEELESETTPTFRCAAATPHVSHEAVDLMQQLLCEPRQVVFHVSVCRLTHTISVSCCYPVWRPGRGPSFSAKRSEPTISLVLMEASSRPNRGVRSVRMGPQVILYRSCTCFCAS